MKNNLTKCNSVNVPILYPESSVFWSEGECPDNGTEIIRFGLVACITIEDQQGVCHSMYL